MPSVQEWLNSQQRAEKLFNSYWFETLEGQSTTRSLIPLGEPASFRAALLNILSRPDTLLDEDEGHTNASMAMVAGRHLDPWVRAAVDSLREEETYLDSASPLWLSFAAKVRTLPNLLRRQQVVEASGKLWTLAARASASEPALHPPLMVTFLGHVASLPAELDWTRTAASSRPRPRHRGGSRARGSSRFAM